MACTLTLAGRGVGCKDALGGIKRIFVTEWTDGLWNDATSGTVDDAAAAEVFLTYDMTRGSGSLNQTITADLAAGTVFFDQVCSVTFNKIAAADIEEISNLVKGRMAVIVKDNNDNIFVMGHKNGVEVTGGTAQTGTAAGDQNGFTIEFSAQEVAPAPFLALDAAGDPSGANITITAAP